MSGVGLYFIYVRRMTLFSFVCTIFTLPHLLMCFFGDSLTNAEMDPLRLLTFAAGNHRCGDLKRTPKLNETKVRVNMDSSR